MSATLLSRPQPRGRPRKGCHWDAYRGWVRDDGVALPIAKPPASRRQVVVARPILAPAPPPPPPPPRPSDEERARLVELAEMAAVRAAQEEAAARIREAAAARERSLREPERYATSLKKANHEWKVYYMDQHYDMYEAGQVPREYRPPKPAPPTQRPKKWRVVTMRVDGPTSDLEDGEFEYRDVRVFA